MLLWEDTKGLVPYSRVTESQIPAKRGSIHNSLDAITLLDAEFELEMRKVMIVLWIMMGRYNSGGWVPE